jgi:hypothetical protein
MELSIKEEQGVATIFKWELTAIPVTGSRSINQLQYNANAVGGSFGGQDSRLNNLQLMDLCF